MISFKKAMSLEDKITFIEALTFIFNDCNTKADIQKTYLERQAFECGLSTKEFKSIKPIKKVAELIKKIKAIPNKKVKRYILREMILIAVIDHELTDQEMCTIYEIGTESGVKQEKINDLFLWAAKGIEWQAEGAHLIEDDF